MKNYFFSSCSAGFALLLTSMLTITGSAGIVLAQPSDRAIAAQHRAHLPMSNTIRASSVVYDAKDPEAKFPPIQTLRPPGGAPNVVIFLIDDAGLVHRRPLADRVRLRRSTNLRRTVLSTIAFIPPHCVLPLARRC